MSSSVVIGRHTARATKQARLLVLGYHDWTSARFPR